MNPTYNSLPKRTNGHLQSLYKSEEQVAIESLTQLENDAIEKGRKGEPIGTKKTWGGVEYIKTGKGWTPSKKAKAAHEVIHGKKEEGDGLQRFKDIVNNSSSLDEAFEKVKTIKDVPANVANLFREKYDPEENLTPKKAFEKFYNEVKGGEKNEGGFKSDDDHGIEVGKVYSHENYGDVKVIKVEKNTGDKQDKISHSITFKTRGGAGAEESQGINGFRHATTGDYNGKPTPKEESKSDIPEAVQEKFESEPKNSNFSFLRLQGKMWRRDNKTGEITEHGQAQNVQLPKSGADSNKEIAEANKTREKREHGEELKAGDDVVVNPNHPEVEMKGKVVESYGVNGVKVDTGKGKPSVYDRKDVISAEKHNASKKEEKPELNEEEKRHYDYLVERFNRVDDAAKKRMVDNSKNYIQVAKEFDEISGTNDSSNDPRVIASKQFVKDHEGKVNSIEDKSKLFAVGTPARTQYEGDEVSGEVVMRDGKKGLKLYKDKNYSGSSERFIVPDWNKVKSFYES